MPLATSVFARMCYFFVLLKTSHCWVQFVRKLRQSRIQDSFNATSGSIHEDFMNLALKEARAAEDIGEVPIGAIVVERAHDGTFNVVSAAHNLVETTHDASAHAELLALRKASKRARNWRLVNATLYSTLEPCPMCLAAAQAFRISSIVYGAPDIRLGAIKTHIKLLEVDHPYHTIGEVIPDVLGEESASMLRSFFRGRRKSNSKSRPSISLPRKLKRWFRL